MRDRETRAAKEQKNKENRNRTKCLGHGIHPPAELKEESAVGWFFRQPEHEKDDMRNSGGEGNKIKQLTVNGGGGIFFFFFFFFFFFLNGVGVVKGWEKKIK